MAKIKIYFDIFVPSIIDVMGFIEILLIAIGLSMDAFAVSIGKGLTCKKVTWDKALCVGLWFGGFQALMPLIGYFVGSSFASLVENVDHWIAFILLALIGGNMIREALSKKDECELVPSSFGFKTMFLMAIATSIDALAAGVTFAFVGCNIWIAIAVIGATTFLFSVIGLCIGHLVGCKFHKGAELFGGIVLVAIGIKILVEHLFF